MGLLGVLIMPITALAQDEPAECCKLGNEIDYTGGELHIRETYNSGAKKMYYGLNGTKTECTTNPVCIVQCRSGNVCTLYENYTVGSTESGTKCSQSNIHTDKDQIPDYATNGWGMTCMMNGVYTIVDWIFVVLIALVGIMIVYGGVMIVTAGGDAGNVKKGRDAITYAAIGFVVALLARAVPSVVQSLLGM